MSRRTLQKYLDLMTHGLGKTPDSRHLLIDTFNDAGKALYTLAEGAPYFHSWSWLTADNVDFTIPGGSVERVELPADFGTFLSLGFRSAPGRSVQTVDMSTLNRLRQATPIVNSRTVYMCFDVGESQANGESTPKKIAAFWPAREDDLTGLELVYRRTWVDMAQADGNRIPNIPAEWDRLLVLLSRAFAIHIEDQAAAMEDENVKPELDRLVHFDAGRMPNKGGPPLHSVRARASNRIDAWYPSGLTRGTYRPSTL